MQMQSKQFADGDRTNTVLGTGLGIFSIGLGLVELTRPKQLANMIGVVPRGAVKPALRMLGLREILHGLTLLKNPQSKLGPWGRVVGDVLDLGFLAWALRSKGCQRNRTLGAIGAVLGVAALDAYTGIRRTRMMLGEPAREQITINRSPEEIYALWRNFERLPQFMSWVQSVQDLGNGRSRWRVATPAGKTIEYEAELVEDVPGRRIAWRSLPGSKVSHAGQITFLQAPGNRGTEVILEMQVAGPLAKTVASAEAKGDLRRFKQVLETGEIVRSDASIHRRPYPAQPPAEV